jgi:TonB family protein
MNKTITTILILALATICNGQTSQTKYFNSEWLGKEVSQEKAKFSQTIIQNADGTITTEVKEIKKNEIVSSETYKGNEPFGIWKFRYDKDYKTIDYNFPLIYSTEKCNDSLPIFTSDYFEDNDSLVYKAPKISTGELTIYQFIGKNIIFPSRAKDEGIQGTVYIQLTLTKEGTFENIVVKRGTNILLDKEAVRVLRQLKFSSPPTIKGQPYNFNCLTLPIKFRLM